MPSFDAALIQRNQAALAKASPLLDKLSKSWEQIEQFFRKQGILRGARYQYGSIYGDFPREDELGAKLLGVQKVKGTWRICYGEELYTHPDRDVDWVPVGDAPTAIRIGLLEHVGPLFEAMVKSNEGYLEEIEQAAAKAQSVLADLEFSDL